MNTKLLISIVFISLSVISCAKRPNAIVPVDVSTSVYDGFACEELALELINENTKLTALSKKQNNAANADAVGVFLVGVPLASLTDNDVEGQIAVTKGRVISIQNTQISKQCAPASITQS